MTIEERKSNFYFIRDIPYKIQLSMEDQDYCCSTKSRILSKLLNALGIQTRFILCQFDWFSTPIPKSILELSNESIVTHMFLDVLVPETNQWVHCDPTWDIGLRKAGFSIEEWDGMSATGIAVKPLRIYAPEESADFIKEYADPDRIKKSLAKQNAFYIKLNWWLAQERA